MNNLELYYNVEQPGNISHTKPARKVHWKSVHESPVEFPRANVGNDGKEIVERDCPCVKVFERKQPDCFARQLDGRAKERKREEENTVSPSGCITIFITIIAIAGPRRYFRPRSAIR